MRVKGPRSALTSFLEEHNIVAPHSRRGRLLQQQQEIDEQEQQQHQASLHDSSDMAGVHDSLAGAEVSERTLHSPSSSTSAKTSNKRVARAEVVSRCRAEMAQAADAGNIAPLPADSPAPASRKRKAAGKSSGKDKTKKQHAKKGKKPSHYSSSDDADSNEADSWRPSRPVAVNLCGGLAGVA